MEAVILLLSRPYSPVPKDEAARQHAVERLPLSDGWPPELDQIAAAAAAVAGTSSGVVTIIDSSWQLMAGCFNHPSRIIARVDTMCAHGIMTPHDMLCVPDIQADRRFSRLGVARGPLAIRFYAGTPILIGSKPVGMLCAIDSDCRSAPDERQQRALRRLARIAASHLQRTTH